MKTRRETSTPVFGTNEAGERVQVTAILATWPWILRGLLSDAIGWLVPFIVAAMAIGFIPAINQSMGWTLTLVIIAAAWTSINIAVDAESVRKNGWTRGFAKTDLYISDPKKDHMKHLARHRKSVRKLLRGEYEVLRCL